MGSSVLIFRQVTKERIEFNRFKCSIFITIFFRKVITHPFPKSVCLTVRPGKNVMNVFSRDMGIKSRSFLSLHKTRLLYSFTHIIPSLEILPPKPRAIIPLLQVIQWNPSTNNGQATLQSCILVSIVLVFFLLCPLISFDKH